MRAKSLLLLVTALGCGLVASIGITQVMSARNAPVAKVNLDTKSIFVVLQDVSMGEPLTAQVVKLEAWPKDRVPPGALTKLEEVEGRRPRTKLYAGEPILDNKLLSKGESNAGASVLIPKGYRVVPVRVDNESGGAAMILPGDRVDLLVHLKKGEDVHETSTRTILQDVKVFAVDDVFAISSEDQKAATAKTISLLLTPPQAEKVALAGELGKIRLVMRNPEDKEQASVEGVMAAELFEDGEKADRAKDESLMSVIEPDTKKDEDFLEFLKSQQSPPAEAATTVAPVSTAPTWTVRTIRGPDVQEVVLQLNEESPAAGAGQSGAFSLWKMISGDLSNDVPTATQPAATAAPSEAAAPASAVTPDAAQTTTGNGDAAGHNAAAASKKE